MRWLATALVAVACSGCAGNPGPSAPTTASSLERQAGVGQSASPQPLTTFADLAPDIEVGPGLAEDDLAVDIPAELDAADLGFEAGDVEESEDPIVTAAPEFDVPGKPTNVNVRAKGLVITMTWLPAPAGKAGPPTSYLVYCSCTGKIETVGIFVFTKSWTATKPGTYTGFVSARNSKGAGPTVNYKITVGADGTYTAAPVSQTATLRKGSCTWRITLKATVTVKITGPKSGTTRVAGSLTWPKPSAKCTGGTAAYSHQAPLVFTASGFSSAHTLSFVAGKFEGAFLNGNIKGYLRMVYRYGTGRYDVPVLLKKT